MNKSESSLRAAPRLALATFGLAACLSLTNGPSCVAQQGGVSGNLSEREGRLRDRERNMRANESELLNRNGRNNNSAPSGETRMTLTVKQIREDFERIQILNLQLREKYTAAGVLNYREVAADTAEIKKRASRLKSNLALPKNKESREAAEVVPVDEAMLPRTLTELSTLIKRFVNNPYFLNPNIIDAQHLHATRDTLDRLIILSGQISKQAKKSDKQRGG